MFGLDELCSSDGAGRYVRATTKTEANKQFESTSE